MTIKNALAGVAVGQLDSAVAWYSKLIGHAPESRPMPEVAEFSFEKGGWLQVYVDSERVGKSSVTLAVSDLEQQLGLLQKAGIEVGKTSRTSFVNTAIVIDPDGNRIVFAEAVDPKNRAVQ